MLTSSNARGSLSYPPRVASPGFLSFPQSSSDLGERVGVAVGENVLELLYQALAQDRGLVIQCEDCDIEELRQRLYRERKKAQDTSLDVLAFVPSPTDPTQLWIVRKDVLNGR